MSDFGRITSFDTTIVRIEVDDGLVGWGEAKAGVGSVGLLSCGGGGCPTTSSGRRSSGRTRGASPRRGTRCTTDRGPATRSTVDEAFRCWDGEVSRSRAMSGIDMALWDLLGKSLDVPVVDLWGGPRTDTHARCTRAAGGPTPPGSASSSSATSAQGFGSVKMRVGVMDGDVETSVERVARRPHVRSVPTSV